MTFQFPGFDRITADPSILGGKPCVRGMRLSVQRVLELLAANPNWDELLVGFPELEEEDVREVLGCGVDDRSPPAPGQLRRVTRLLLDICVDRRLVGEMEGLGYDTVHVSALGMARATDGEVMAIALG